MELTQLLELLAFTGCCCLPSGSGKPIRSTGNNNRVPQRYTNEKASTVVGEKEAAPTPQSPRKGQRDWDEPPPISIQRGLKRPDETAEASGAEKVPRGPELPPIRSFHYDSFALFHPLFFSCASFFFSGLYNDDGKPVVSDCPKPIAASSGCRRISHNPGTSVRKYFVLNDNMLVKRIYIH